MKPPIIVIWFALLSLIAACQPGTPPPSTIGAEVQIAVDATASAVTTIRSGTSSLLSKAAEAACAGQALANLATDLFLATGRTDAAATSAAISAKLGVGCTWGRMLP